MADAAPSGDGPAATVEGCGPNAAPISDPILPLRQRVFETVRAAGQIPRVDVAKALGVSAGTVTVIVSDLIRQGILAEIDAAPHERTRGRPPVALQVNPHAAHVAGIKLGADNHSGVVINLAGGVVAEATLPRRFRKAPPEEVLAEASTLLDQLRSASGLSQFDGLGLGLAGAIRHDTGVMLWSPLVEGRDVAIREMAEQAFGLPVEVDNDVNLVTLAELWYGAGRDLSDFAVVTIEHGVGMGLVLGNRVYRGANGVGMELGHTKVQLDGALCRCGQRGCLEAYVADYALVREASVALELDRDHSAPMTEVLENLYEQARQGNEAARAIFRRAGRYLAIGIANVTNLFDPSRVILSGERLRYDYLYNEEVLAEMNDHTLRVLGGPKRVDIHSWDNQVWARGAATLALETVTARLTAEAGAAA
ncbi:MAG: ROK family transcriptional regulator [Pseudomonadota bacterium]